MRRRGAEWLLSSHHICDPPDFYNPLFVRHAAPGRRMAALEPPHLRSARDWWAMERYLANAGVLLY